MESAVIFESNGEHFAFSASCLIEINSRSEYTFVPRLPEYIIGVINLMGDVIPVIDFRKKLGFPDCEYTSHSCLMVVKSEENTAAIKVDGVVTSVQYNDENFMEIPDGDSIISGYINGKNGDRISLVNEKEIFKQ
jgi:purine-binding chemotaxis protein CheW